MSKDSEGKLTCKPIFSRIVSLYTEQNELQFAVPGGLIGVGTKIEPTLCRADRLVGQVLGAVGALPSIFIELEVSILISSCHIITDIVRPMMTNIVARDVYVVAS